MDFTLFLSLDPRHYGCMLTEVAAGRKSHGTCPDLWEVDPGSRV